jgi:Mor family transcriptional regulator
MENEQISLEDVHPFYAEVAAIVGADNALKLGRAFGGTSRYFPRIKSGSAIETRDKRIAEEFDGTNWRALATKYRLSGVWIRRIVARERKKKRELPA